MADEIDLIITDIAPDGRGIGNYHGRNVFVPYAIPGEAVTVKIVDETSDGLMGIGHLVLEASADRVLPRCGHFGAGQCAGCQWQHMAYEAQLALKTDIVAQQLETIGGFRNPPIKLALGSPQLWEYANHATFFPSTDGTLGFLNTDGNSVISLEECHIIYPDILALLNELNLSLDTLKSVELHANGINDRMIVIQTTNDEAPELEITLPVSLNFLLSHHEPFNMIGATHLRLQMLDRSFRVTAGVPYRTNLGQTEQLVRLVVNYLELQPRASILDLYGGIGTFSAFIAPQVRHVTYIDSYPPAATDAEFNLAEFENIDIIEGRVDYVLPTLIEAHANYHGAIVDPPMQGLNRAVLDNLKKLAIPILVYVSQNPATFAHDAKVFVHEQGYDLLEVQPIDFAPQTAAIECVGVFKRARI